MIRGQGGKQDRESRGLKKRGTTERGKTHRSARPDGKDEKGQEAEFPPVTLTLLGTLPLEADSAL